MRDQSQHDLSQIPGAVRDVRAALVRLGQRARVLLVARRLAFGLSAVIGASLLIGAADFALRFPAFVRTAGLLAGLFVAFVWVRRILLPALRFAPSHTDLALRVEQILPNYKGVLASAVEFTDRVSTTSSATERALIHRAVDEAGTIAEQVGGISASSLLKPKPAAQTSAVALFAFAALLAVALVAPTLFGIGARRVYLPFTDASWPRRTDIADATKDEFHALGDALTLRAALMRSPGNAGGADVSVRYRLIKDGRELSERRELMTWQERPTTALRDADTDGSGQLFERLIEPDADAIEYRFETADDTTEWRRIALIEPPRVTGASATITPPVYASDLESPEATGAIADLGPGTDERAIAAPSLAGSDVTLNISLNKPVAIPESVKLILGDTARITDNGDSWTFAFTLDDSIRLPLTLRDSFGIESVDDAVFRFEALIDAEPTATVTEPRADESVLPTAVVQISGEGRDDVGLAWIELERTIFKPAGAETDNPSGPGGAMEPQSDPVAVARVDSTNDLLLTTTARIDLSVLGVRAGDEIHVQAVARDIYAVPGATREPTRSTIRVLRVLSETEFIEDIQNQLGDIRQSAIRIDEQQIETTDLGRERGATRPTTRSQGQVTERIARQSEIIERLSERIERNALNDSGLKELLSQAQRSLDRAGESSVEASQELGEAADRAEAEQREAEGEYDPEAFELSDEEQRDVEQAQEQVRAELAQLIEQLDRGQDNWVVRNTIENALAEQQQLQSETESLGSRTAGQSADELSPEDKSDLDRIVEKQLELAERLRELTESLRDREQKLREDDPGAAEALARAAETADELELVESMERAAREASQNQSSNAQQSQQQASDALEEILQDLESGQRAREEALQRALKSIIESLEGIIRAQRNEIDALANAVTRNAPLAPLSQGMIRLNQNTLGVRDLAFEGGSDLAPIFNLLESASDAQVRAVRELRDADPSADEAREHETQSLDLLTRALERAEEAEQDIQDQQDQQKKEELKKAYLEALEAQVALVEQTDAFAQAETLSRRDRVLVRRLGEPQRGVGTILTELRERVKEIADAKVFDYAHTRLDKLIERAAVELESSEPANAVRSQRSIIRVLEGLIRSLEESQQQQDGGEQQQSGGGGQGSEQGEQALIPPAQELKLLRDFQIQLAQETTDLSVDPATPTDRVKDLGSTQRELLELGEDLIRRVSQEGPPASNEGIPMDIPEPEPAEDPNGTNEAEPGNNPERESDPDGN